MKQFNLVFILLFSLLFSTACDTKGPIDETDNKKPPSTSIDNKYVNDWIFETMNIYYYWNYSIPSKPDFTASPDMFFDALLSKYNKNSNPNGDRFSWIQKDYVELLNSLSGVTSDEIGFEFVRVAVSERTPTQYYLLVIYPKKGTSAEANGVRKGQFVVQINDQDITDDNYSNLVNGSGNRKLEIAEWVLAEENKYALKTTQIIDISMHKNYAEHPVYLDTVYTMPNGKKAGYLVYNFFANDSGDKTRKYDIDLMKAIERINNAGNMQDFILDLRYNGGGSVASAAALASALAPNRNSQDLFSYVEYNPLVHEALKRQNGDDFNKDYFIDEIKLSSSSSYPIPNLNLSKLYILVSRWSASASEMVINGLKPYFGDNIVLIGETTVGKNVGSTSFYEEDDPKNKWGMQPIIAKFFNKNGESDFTAGFIPNHPVSEIDNTLFLYEFGDTQDKMLNKALTLINDGQTIYASPQKSPQFSSSVKMKVVKGSSSMLDKPGKNILNDDVRGEMIRKLNF